MINPATAQVECFQRNMETIAVGAKLSRRHREWTVCEFKRHETSASLLLRSGEHVMNVSVPICITGPCLADVDLRYVSPAPRQKVLS